MEKIYLKQTKKIHLCRLIIVPYEKIKKIGVFYFGLQVYLEQEKLQFLKIYKQISKEFGKTIIINGDDIRKIFELKGFDYKDRKK